MSWGPQSAALSKQHTNGPSLQRPGPTHPSALFSAKQALELLDQTPVAACHVMWVPMWVLPLSEWKWTGMGEFNSDDHYIYYCGQESLGRNGVAIMVNK